MSRGFTLLELVITVAVLAILYCTAAPSFQNLWVDGQMKGAADELSGFISQARSEAIWRNQDLWAHFLASNNPAMGQEWKLSLTDSDKASQGNEILQLQGARYRALQFEWSYTANKIKFDGARGRIKDGNIKFYAEGQESKALRIKSSYAGNRVMICAIAGEQYGFPQC